MSRESSAYVVLVAVEFDETGECALREAARLASSHFNAQLHIVHVVPEALADAPNGELLALNVRLSRAPEKLKQLVENVWREHPVKVTTHIRSGLPVPTILQTAVDIDSDIIVIGTHKRNAVERLVLGSVGARLVLDARCPVLIAIAKELAASTHVEPACAQCASVRRDTNNHTYWCQQHARSRLEPDVYEPRSSSIPTPLYSR